MSKLLFYTKILLPLLYILLTINGHASAADAFLPKTAYKHKFIIAQSNSNEVKDLAKLADKYFGDKEYKKAIKYANQALDLSPNNTGLLYIRGTAYLLLKKVSKGISDLTKAIEIGHKTSYADLGFIYATRGSAYITFKKNKRKEGLADLHRSIEISIIKKDSSLFTLAQSLLLSSNIVPKKEYYIGDSHYKRVDCTIIHYFSKGIFNINISGIDLDNNGVLNIEFPLSNAAKKDNLNYKEIAIKSLSWRLKPTSSVPIVTDNYDELLLGTSLERISTLGVVVAPKNNKVYYYMNYIPKRELFEKHIVITMIGSSIQNLHETLNKSYMNRLKKSFKKIEFSDKYGIVNTKFFSSPESSSYERIGDKVLITKSMPKLSCKALSN